MDYRRERFYYVYILSNRSKTLYVGVTNSVRRRAYEHKQGGGSEFTSRYKLDRLVTTNASVTSVARSRGRSKSRAGCG